MRIEQDNGNTQINSIRNEFNDRTKSKNYMGNGLRIFWNERRRFRYFWEELKGIFIVYFFKHRIRQI